MNFTDFSEAMATWRATAHRYVVNVLPVSLKPEDITDEQWASASLVERADYDQYWRIRGFAWFGCLSCGRPCRRRASCGACNDVVRRREQRGKAQDVQRYIERAGLL